MTVRSGKSVRAKREGSPCPCLGHREVGNLLAWNGILPIDRSSTAQNDIRFQSSIVPKNRALGTTFTVLPIQDSSRSGKNQYRGPSISSTAIQGMHYIRSVWRIDVDVYCRTCEASNSNYHGCCESDFGRRRTRGLRTGVWPERIKRYLSFKDERTVVNGILLRGEKLVIPSSLRKTVLALSHLGHPGMERTKQRLRSKVWWPNMNNDIEKLIRSCLDCQTVGQPGPQEPMQIRDLPQAPWSHLSMDILGPLPSGESLLVLIDLYSRFRVIEILWQTTTASILSKIRPVFMRLGMPQTLTTDNASNFSSREMVDFCKRYDIQRKHTTPYWPQANGNVERQNRSIMKILRISALNGSDWKADLEEHNYVYSVTPHPATGRSPAEVAFGRPFKDWIPQFFRIDFDDDEDI